MAAIHSSGYGGGSAWSRDPFGPSGEGIQATARWTLRAALVRLMLTRVVIGDWRFVSSSFGRALKRNSIDDLELLKRTILHVSLCSSNRALWVNVLTAFAFARRPNKLLIATKIVIKWWHNLMVAIDTQFVTVKTAGFCRSRRLGPICVPWALIIFVISYHTSCIIIKTRY